MRRTTKFLAAVACCFGALGASTAFAGILPTHPDALFGGGPDGGYWRGSVSYDNGLGLAGDIDFAVFTEGQFNANFSGLGYTPSASGVVYVYQLFNAGDLFVSAQIQGMSGPADTIGTFAIDDGDVDAAATDLVSMAYAEWDFFDDGPGGVEPDGPILTGDASYGLAFSSPNLPIFDVSLTINGGFSILSFGIPAPGSVPIPEPGSLALVALAGFGALSFHRRHRDRIRIGKA